MDGGEKMKELELIKTANGYKMKATIVNGMKTYGTFISAVDRNRLFMAGQIANINGEIVITEKGVEMLKQLGYNIVVVGDEVS